MTFRLGPVDEMQGVFAMSLRMGSVLRLDVAVCALMLLAESGADAASSHLVACNIEISIDSSSSNYMDALAL